MYLKTNLKHLRQILKRSQTDVAHALDFTRSSYSGYELGTAEPNTIRLVKLANYYRVSLDTLVLEDLRTYTLFALTQLQRQYRPREIHPC